MEMPLDIWSGLEQLDVNLLLAVNRWRSPWADDFMRLFSEKWIWVPMYVALAYAIVRNLRWKQVLPCFVALALAIVLADQTCGTFIRPWVCRLRPANLQNPLSAMIQVVDGFRGGFYGFPSCHAANTWAVAVFFLLLFRNPKLSLFLAGWALLTCYSRAYMGLHYPGDLLAGGLTGAAISFLCYRLFMGLVTPGTCNTDGSEANPTPRQPKQLFIPVVVGLLTMLYILIYSLVRPA